MKKSALIILIVCVYSLQYAQSFLQIENEILQLQDQRSPGSGKLVSTLNDQNVQLRYRAAIALANLQDTSTVDALAGSLKDSDRNVRAASALALGQIRTERAAIELLSVLPSEQDTCVIAGILEALGKCGSSICLDSLLTLDEQSPAKFPPKEFAMCIARFAIRQVRTERSIWKCFEYTHSNSTDVCSSALYALWRSAPNGLVDLEISKQKDELSSLSKNNCPEIRMHLATLLGRSKTNESREILDTLEQEETILNDWHVWVQIIRARAVLSSAPPGLSMNYPRYLAMKNNHIKITALQAMSTSPSLSPEQSAVVDSIRSMLTVLANDINAHEAVRGEALVALGKHFPKELESFQPWITDRRISPLLKTKLMEAIAQQNTKEHLTLLRRNLHHESNRVAMAAWDYIRQMLNPLILKNLGLDSIERGELPKEIFQEAKSALTKNDMGITTIVANFFADTMVFKNFRTTGFADKIVDEFISVYGNLTHIDDVEAKQAVLQTLGNMNNTRALPFLEKEVLESDQAIAAEAAASLYRMTGKDYSGKLHRQPVAGRAEEDWDLLKRIKPRQHVRIVTNRGEFTIELMKDHAPFTVLNFVKLVQKDFYNGLTFHRVVPDFVVQGGDPRGDGWGGPGYTMRTEISTVHYERGSCGMASAGRDTEGSQFFITHVSTPHLDGRYTIFARVVQGMDVVDLLQIGDVITAMQLLEE